jgi:DNA polymerase
MSLTDIMSNVVTLDFETYYDDDYSLKKMTMVKYINDPRFKIHGVGIKVNDNATVWHRGGTALIYAMDILDDYAAEGYTFIAQNAQFDMLILTQLYNIVPKRYLCTECMSRGVFPGMPANLADICLRLFPNDETLRKGDELEISKGCKDLDDTSNKIIGDYCINDVDITYAAAMRMSPALNEEEHKLISMFVRMYAEPVLVLDDELVKSHKADLAEKRENTIKASGLTAKQLGSNQQFSTYVEDVLRIKVPMKKSPTTGKPIPAFGKNDLPFQKIQNAYPEFDHIWKARVAVKSTAELARCDRLLESTINGLLPVPLNYSGAGNTHRASGSEKINLQNLKRGSNLRRALCAALGYKIGAVDSAQIEARILCVLAGQDDVTELFRRGVCTYCAMAQQIYGHEVIKNRSDQDNIERFVGKVGRLSLGFGASGDTLYATLKSGAMGPPLDISLQECKRIVYDVFRPENSMIKELWDIADEWLWQMHDTTKIIEHEYFKICKEAVILPNNMFIRFYNLKWEPTQYDGRVAWSYFDGRKRVKIYGAKLVENIVQALARIAVFYPMIEIDDFLMENDYGRVVHTVHDETVPVVRTEALKAYEEFAGEKMRASPVWMPTLPLDCEFSIGDRYEK